MEAEVGDGVSAGPRPVQSEESGTSRKKSDKSDKDGNKEGYFDQVNTPGKAFTYIWDMGWRTIAMPSYDLWMYYGDESENELKGYVNISEQNVKLARRIEKAVKNESKLDFVSGWYTLRNLRTGNDGPYTNQSISYGGVGINVNYEIADAIESKLRWVPDEPNYAILQTNDKEGKTKAAAVIFLKFRNNPIFKTDPYCEAKGRMLAKETQAKPKEYTDKSSSFNLVYAARTALGIFVAAYWYTHPFGSKHSMMGSRFTTIERKLGIIPPPRW